VKHADREQRRKTARRQQCQRAKGGERRARRENDAERLGEVCDTPAQRSRHEPDGGAGREEHADLLGPEPAAGEERRQEG